MNNIRKQILFFDEDFLFWLNERCGERDGGIFFLPEYPTETSRIPHRKNKNTPQKHLEYPIEKIKTPPHGKHPEHPEYTIAFFIVSLSKP
jgi:hypothetical protein